MKNRDSPIVYICSRYRGDIAHNMAMARRYSRYAADRGCVPLTPHLWLPLFFIGRNGARPCHRHGPPAPGTLRRALGMRG